LMTSGKGIAHSEETPKTNSGTLDGVQLWVALPVGQRDIAPAFHHYASLPVLDFAAGTIVIIAGTLSGETSPAQMFSPIVGAEIVFRTREPLQIPVRRDFEHALFVLQGEASLNTHPLEAGTLHYLGTNRDELNLAGAVGSRVLLIGGEPFNDPIVMWWNFVATTREEIASAREDWINQQRFGEVKAYHGARLPAPDLARLAPANPVS